MAGIKDSFVKGITAINMKTNNFMEESKCKTYITTLENEIKDLKLQIGETAYNGWLNGQEYSQEIQQYFEQISEKYKEIQNQNEKMKMLEIEAQQVMGTVNNVPSNQEEIAQNMVYCSNCGAQVPVSHKFCVKCGNKMV